MRPLRIYIFGPTMGKTERKDRGSRDTLERNHRACLRLCQRYNIECGGCLGPTLCGDKDGNALCSVGGIPSPAPWGSTRTIATYKCARA